MRSANRDILAGIELRVISPHIAKQDQFGALQNPAAEVQEKAAVDVANSAIGS